MNKISYYSENARWKIVKGIKHLYCFSARSWSYRPKSWFPVPVRLHSPLSTWRLQRESCRAHQCHWPPGPSHPPSPPQPAGYTTIASLIPKLHSTLLGMRLCNIWSLAYKYTSSLSAHSNKKAVYTGSISTVHGWFYVWNYNLQTILSCSCITQ